MPRHSRWQQASRMTDYERRHSQHRLCPTCGALICNDSKYCTPCLREIQAKVSSQVARLCALAREAR